MIKPTPSADEAQKAIDDIKERTKRLFELGNEEIKETANAIQERLEYLEAVYRATQG